MLLTIGTIVDPKMMRSGGFSASTTDSSAAAVAVGSLGSPRMLPTKAFASSRRLAYAGNGVACLADDPAQSVAKNPGSTSVTLTPKGSTSKARASLKASSANLDAQYRPRFGPVKMPPVDET